MTLEMIQTIVILPLVTALVGVIINLIVKYSEILQDKNADSKARKYIVLAENLVVSSVGMVYQTYVDALKKAGSFGPEEQKIAFDKAKLDVLKQLTLEGKKAIEYLYVDVDEWIQTQIEYQISQGIDNRPTMLETFRLTGN